ncbi:MAG: HAD family hydrolase [Lachnospiraceae bacterium]|nr:HAD family hydrolase [Lachnospiraceae bacterium]
MIKAIIFDMFETLITHYESPLYFGSQMAADAGVPEEDFIRVWRQTEDDRTIGKLTLEQAIELVLKKNNRYSEEILNTIVSKREATKIECFKHLHLEIIPMLDEIKKQGLKIGLISNCFSEEAKVIRNSILFPYFDATYLSFEQGIQKPDEEIFLRCMNELQVSADECLYVGDGGSFELETAAKLGMKTLQAVWYLKEESTQPAWRKNEFVQVETPMELVQHISEVEYEIYNK